MKNICFLSLVTFLSANILAQTKSSIPYQSLLNVNPSYAGSNGGIRNQVLGQVPSSEKYNAGFYGFTNAFDCYLPSIKSGIGVSVGYENSYNILKNRSANIAYSKYFKVGDKLKIVPSLQLGYALKEINSQWLYSPAKISNEQYSIGSGILLNYKNLYGGLSISGITKPQMSSTHTNTFFYNTYQFHASYNLNVSEFLKINLFGQITSQLSYNSYLASVNLLCFKRLIYGTGFRYKDIVFMNIGYRADYFNLQVSFNKNTSTLTPSDFSNDYWQASLSFNLRNKEQRHSITNFETW